MIKGILTLTTFLLLFAGCSLENDTSSTNSTETYYSSDIRGIWYIDSIYNMTEYDSMGTMILMHDDYIKYDDLFDEYLRAQFMEINDSSVFFMDNLKRSGETFRPWDPMHVFPDSSNYYLDTTDNIIYFSNIIDFSLNPDKWYYSIDKDVLKFTRVSDSIVSNSNNVRASDPEFHSFYIFVTYKRYKGNEFPPKPWYSSSLQDVTEKDDSKQYIYELSDKRDLTRYSSHPTKESPFIDYDYFVFTPEKSKKYRLVLRSEIYLPNFSIGQFNFESLSHPVVLGDNKEADTLFKPIDEAATFASKEEKSEMGLPDDTYWHVLNLPEIDESMSYSIKVSPITPLFYNLWIEEIQ